MYLILYHLFLSSSLRNSSDYSGVVITISNPQPQHTSRKPKIINKYIIRWDFLAHVKHINNIKIVLNQSLFIRIKIKLPYQAIVITPCVSYRPYTNSFGSTWACVYILNIGNMKVYYIPFNSLMRKTNSILTHRLHRVYKNQTV